MELKVVPKEILLQAKSSQGYGWAILEQLADEIAQSEMGDSAETSLGLQIFEGALDYRVGIAFVNLLKSCPKGKLPKPFTMVVPRNGKIKARFASGREYEIE